MSARPKILIVDDEPDVLLTLRMILEAEGFAPALAADGETALRRIDEEHPDLVVLDIMMPVLDGWFVLAELAGRAHRPCVVVCSAKSRPRPGALGRRVRHEAVRAGPPRRGDPRRARATRQCRARLTTFRSTARSPRHREKAAGASVVRPTMRGRDLPISGPVPGAAAKIPLAPSERPCQSNTVVIPSASF
jgi:CheY-like chemotaxis protein